jgi:hypothetical protein
LEESVLRTGKSQRGDQATSLSALVATTDWGALKPEASKSSGKVVSSHGRWKQLLFTLGLLIKILFHLKEM